MNLFSTTFFSQPLNDITDYCKRPDTTNEQLLPDFFLVICVLCLQTKRQFPFVIPSENGNSRFYFLPHNILAYIISFFSVIWGNKLICVYQHIEKLSKKQVDQNNGICLATLSLLKSCGWTWLLIDKRYSLTETGSRWIEKPLVAQRVPCFYHPQ